LHARARAHTHRETERERDRERARERAKERESAAERTTENHGEVHSERARERERARESERERDRARVAERARQKEPRRGPQRERAPSSSLGSSVCLTGAASTDGRFGSTISLSSLFLPSTPSRLLPTVWCVLGGAGGAITKHTVWYRHSSAVTVFLACFAYAYSPSQLYGRRKRGRPHLSPWSQAGSGVNPQAGPEPY
jgi:hypothetical protein